jgi:hypothetical protein
MIALPHRLMQLAQQIALACFALVLGLLAN